MPTLNRPRLVVLGAGSFATAWVKILSENQTVDLFWWIRRPEVLDHVLQNHYNPGYLRGVELWMENDHVSTQLGEMLGRADWVLLAIPAAFLDPQLSELPRNAFAGKKVISVIKGMVPGYDQVVADYMHTVFGVPIEDFMVLTGPCHAEEIAQEKLSYLTVACQNKELARVFQAMIQNRYIRTQYSLDIYGTEYASVLKNIIALASGVFHGLDYGDNFQAVFIANAIVEIRRFIEVMDPLPRDITDSAYLGDLLVTAYSQFSRNRTFGTMIGKGFSIKSAQLEMNMIAEGYYASASIQHLIEKFGLDMPILEAVYRILYKAESPRMVMEQLTFALH